MHLPSTPPPLEHSLPAGMPGFEVVCDGGGETARADLRGNGRCADPYLWKALPADTSTNCGPRREGYLRNGEAGRVSSALRPHIGRGDAACLGALRH